jgi:hypothetical protein
MVRAMYRLALVGAITLAACTQSDNDRPATLEYVTEAILQPSCGQYDCHSSFARTKGYAFDTVAEAKQSLSRIVIPTDPDASLLFVVLTRQIKRMPYDSPLPDKDIALIRTWITDGAPGLGLDIP